MSSLFTNLAEAFRCIEHLRSAGRKSVCRGCHLDAAGTVGCHCSDKNPNPVAGWPETAVVVCGGCRGAVRECKKRRSSS